MGYDKHEEADGEMDEELTADVDNASQDETKNYDTSPDDDDWSDKFPITPPSEFEIEEGHILTGVNRDPMDDDFNYENFPEFFVDGRSEDDVLTGRYVRDDVDNSWILEVMAKMEQRRQRFKDPIVPKKEAETIPNQTEVDPFVEMSKTIDERPTRKRRWGGILIQQSRIIMY